MQKRHWIATAGCAGLLALSSCENLPGGKKEQSAAIGGVTGAAIGAVAGESALAALLGGAIGAGAGYLIGAEFERLDENRADEARAAVEEAQRDPASVDDVYRAQTADLDGNGFVTIDEVLAMERAGLSDEEMLRRLEATGQVFELTAEQEDHLVDAGVSRRVVQEMQTLNEPDRERLGLGDREPISRQPGG